MINDSFIKNILSPVLFIMFLIIILPSVFSSLMIFETSSLSTGLFSKDIPTYLLNIEAVIIRVSSNFSTLPKDIILTIVQLLPILIGALCYRDSQKGSLNILGKLSFFVLLIGIFLSLITLILLPSESNYIANISTEKSYELIKDSNESVLRNSITYFLLFAGLTIPVNKHGDQ